MTPNIDSSWIQGGELGLAFVVIVMCVFLVVFVFRQSAKREDKLMGMLENQQTITARQGEILQKMAGYLDTLGESMEAIKEALQYKQAKRRINDD